MGNDQKFNNTLLKKWKVVDPSPENRLEDLSIFTEDDEEIIRGYEWILADKEIFEHAVKRHNEWVEETLDILSRLA